MKLLQRQPTPNGPFLMWFGLIGAGISWALMFLFGYGLSVATCNVFVRDTPFELWTIIDTAVGAALAILGTVAAVSVFRATRDPVGDRTGEELAGKGGPPPDGRTHFLAIIGMSVSPLFLCIILASGLGAFFLPTCVQA